MKNIGIHVLDFNDKIIDYISRNDNALMATSMKISKEDKSETFDFTISSDRAENLRERNRIIAQDNNGKFKEFIITLVSDNFDGTTDIESNASYLEDLDKSKPIKPSSYKANTTSQALSETLRNTDWEVSDDIEYGGQRTTSWSSYVTPYELINQLCTTYKMTAEYYVELGAHTIEHRYVSLKKPVSLFKGKEITKGKDLKEMKRTVDLSEVRTALYAIGPEKDDGTRIELIHVDDEAQSQFGLPGRYLWGVYEPQSDDTEMSRDRLLTLTKTQMNKVNKAAISYEISSASIDKFYSDVEVAIGDTVRIKDRDFKPALYVDAEVIEIDYDLISENCEFKFGNVIEYNETSLRDDLTKRLDDINKKLNDKFSNINTIVNDAMAGELEYFERKIIKSDTPPENPVEDMLWYDTSNPNVGVIKHYHNGEWRNETAKNVEQLGGMTREQVLFASISNTFENLSIQHSKLLEEVYQVLENEYLIDESLKAELSQALDSTVGIYSSIKNNLDSMTESTATIGKLIDTQSLFLTYRKKLQALYDVLKRAKYAAEDRFKLLQLQYTDEKFNEAMSEIADSLPNGKWDSEKNILTADIPNKEELDDLKKTLQNYSDDKVSSLKNEIDKTIDSKVTVAKDEISSNVSSLEKKVEGLTVGGRNLFEGSLDVKKDWEDEQAGITQFFRADITNAHDKLKLGDEVTVSFDIQMQQGLSLKVYDTNVNYDFIIGHQAFKDLGNERKRISYTTTLKQANKSSSKWLLDFYNEANAEDKFIVENIKIEKGNVATDYSIAPEDNEKMINEAQLDAENAAKAYADAQDNLRRIEANAYADGIVTEAEKRAIQDASSKRDEAKIYADQKAKAAQDASNQNTANQLKPITARVTTNETSISELDKQIGLMAKSSDVSQKLKDVDGRLTPLETTVQNNKATLDILPTKIDSKVSKQDYTTDKNNIVERLNNADSDRIQLANKIEDRVTITEYNSGIDSVKSTNRNYMQSYYSPSQNIVNGSINGAYSVTLNTSRTLNFYFYDRGAGTNPTLEQNTDYILKIHESDINVKAGVFYKKGSYSIVGYTTDKVIRFNTKDYQDIRIVLTPTADNQFIGKVSLYKGSKELDWTPAPEDIEILARKSQQDAEEAAKAYTDAQDNLKETQLKAYADGIVSNEEKRAIQDAKNRLEEAKTHADKTAEIAQQAAQNYTNDEINNLDIGSENLLLDSERRSDGANTTTHSFIRYYLTRPLETGKTYTLKASILTTDERQSGQISVYPYFPNGTRETVNIKDGKITYTFTAKTESTQFLIYKDVAGQSDVDLNVTIEEAILVEGDKVTGWSPANQDVKKDIQQAEANAKSYTDKYKQSNDIAMTKLETSVSQLDGEVSIKVDEQKFNASQKVLSKVLTEIAATTSGINLSYDNNSVIQSVAVDRSGVKLRGDKVDITVNKDFNLMTSTINNKVGKNEIINQINLSKEGLNIDVNKVALRGGDNVNYTYLSQDRFEMAGVFQRTWQGDTQKDNVYMRAQGGLLRFRNNSRDRSIYYSDFGISTFIDGDTDGASGTIQFFDYNYSPSKSVRGITINSAGGAVALNSERNRIVLDAGSTTNIESKQASIYLRPFKETRAGVNEFRFWTKLAATENETDGVLSYGAVTELPDGTLPGNSMGASLRFEKNPRGGSTIYATNVNGDIGTGSFYAYALYGDWITKNTNLYAEVGNELRITDLQGYNGGKPNYMNLRASTIRTTSSYAFENHSGGDTYFGVGGGELRITNNNHYNGGNTSYKNIRFGKWYAMSSEKFKYDIKEWNYSVLDAYRNDLKLYSYKYKTEKDSKYIRNHHGVIIEREMPIEWRHGDGFDGNEVMFWNAKAIQELVRKIDEQDKKINELEKKINE